jgi:hypothetical protein
VHATTDLIRNLESIKSLALEQFYTNSILSARAEEVALLKRYRMLFAVLKAMTMILSPLVLLTSLAIYVMQGKELSA